MTDASHLLAQEIIESLRQLRSRKTHAIRAKRREFSKRLKAARPEEILKIAAKLLESPEVHRFVAYELIYHHKPALAEITAANLEGLGRGISSWDQTDTFGIYLAGPAWRAGQVDATVIQKWARSKDRWWRRAALVATVPLNTRSQGGRGDVRRTLQVCRMLESDRDPMVVKALSWALRVLSKVEPRAVRGYVSEREAGLAPLVRREVRNKLTTGLKNPRNPRLKRQQSIVSGRPSRAGQGR